MTHRVKLTAENGRCFQLYTNKRKLYADLKHDRHTVLKNMCVKNSCTSASTANQIRGMPNSAHSRRMSSGQILA